MNIHLSSEWAHRWGPNRLLKGVGEATTSRRPISFGVGPLGGGMA